jgi:hypothetical protein
LTACIAASLIIGTDLAETTVFDREFDDTLLFKSAYYRRNHGAIFLFADCLAEVINSLPCRSY